MVLSKKETEACESFTKAYRQAGMSPCGRDHDGFAMVPQTLTENLRNGSFLSAITGSWAAATPLVRDVLSDRPTNAGKTDGFLKMEARALESRVIEYLGRLEKQYPNTWNHLPVAFVAEEFRTWAVGPAADGTWTPMISMASPSDGFKAEILKRVALVRDLVEGQPDGVRAASTDFLCKDKLGFPRVMSDLSEHLQCVLERWPYYQAQEDLHTKLADFRNDLKDVLRHGLKFIFYILRKEDVGPGFDVARFLSMNPAERPRLAAACDTLTGRLLSSMLCDHFLVHAVTGDFPKRDHDHRPCPRLDGGLRKLADALGHNPAELDLEWWAQSKSGIVPRERCCLTDYDWQDMMQHFLAMHTAVACLARCWECLHHMYQLASLGGELLLSSCTPKRLLDVVVRLSGEGIKVFKESSSKVDTLVSRGRREVLSAGRQVPRSAWEDNVEHASRPYKDLQNMLDHCSKKLGDIGRSTEGLSPQGLRVRLTEAASQFRVAVVHTLEQFKDWQSFALADEERKEVQQILFQSPAESCPPSSERKGLVDLVDFFENSEQVFLQLKEAYNYESTFKDIGEGLQPHFDGVLRIVFIGRISAGKTSVLNQILQSGLISGSGRHPSSPLQILPTNRNKNTSCVWHISSTLSPAALDPGSITVQAKNSEGQQVFCRTLQANDLNLLQDCISTMLHEVKPKDLGRVHIYLPKQATYCGAGSVFEWRRPDILDRAELLDTPGLGELDRDTFTPAESCVRELANRLPCVFVWCVPYDQAELLSTDCRFAVELARTAPETMMVLITKMNKAREELRGTADASPAKQNALQQLRERIDVMQKLERAAQDGNRDARDRVPPGRTQSLIECEDNLKDAMYEHELHENLAEICADAVHLLEEGVQRQLLSQHRPNSSTEYIPHCPVAFLGNAYQRGRGGAPEEFDLCLLWALLRTLHRRFREERDRGELSEKDDLCKQRCILSELLRLQRNAAQLHTQLLAQLVLKRTPTSGEDAIGMILNSEKPLKRHLEELARTYDQAVDALVADLDGESVHAMIQQAHKGIENKRGVRVWTDGRNAYLNLLRKTFVDILTKKLQSECQARSNACRGAALRTYRWLATSYPGSWVTTTNRVTVSLTSCSQLEDVIKNLDDLVTTTEVIHMGDKKVPRHSFVSSYTRKTRDGNDRERVPETKKALQQLMEEPFIPVDMVFDTWIAETAAKEAQVPLLDLGLFLRGSPLMSGLFAASVFAAGHVTRFAAMYFGAATAEAWIGASAAAMLLNPATAVGVTVAAGALGIAAHVGYTYEEVQTAFIDHYRSEEMKRLQKMLAHEKEDIRNSIQGVAKTVLELYLTDNASAAREYFDVSGVEHLRECIAQVERYKKKVDEHVGRNRSTFSGLILARNERLRVLTEGFSRQQPPTEEAPTASRSEAPAGFCAAAAVQHFLTEQNELAGHPVRAVSMQGRSVIVHGNPPAIAERSLRNAFGGASVELPTTPTYEPHVFHPVEDHVAKFIFQEWVWHYWRAKPNPWGDQGGWLSGRLAAFSSRR